MAIAGKLISLTQKLSRAIRDPESYPAGSASARHYVSSAVTMSHEQDLCVYHLPDDHLGHGASFGNESVWAETKGNGDLLSLFSVKTGRQLLGGMSVNFLLPFYDLSITGRGRGRSRQAGGYAPAISFAPGTIHLHPAHQQREFIIADGLHVLKTFYIPRTGQNDPAAASLAIVLTNNTDHPVRIALCASLDLDGSGSRDLVARYDQGAAALFAWSPGDPNNVRFYGADVAPRGYWATVDKEEAFAPRSDLPNRFDDTGPLIGSLQFNFLLLPNQHRKIRLIMGFSHQGQERAMADFRRCRRETDALKRTIQSYRHVLEQAELRMPSDLLTQGVQWAKANMLRTIAHYPVGRSFTNDPGKSSHIVGRDTAWFCYGCDFFEPKACCDMLRILAHHQREDGLIAEYIDGLDGSCEFHDFNINDNTPLFVLAACHHIAISGHANCAKELYEPARRAAELILRCRDERGVVRCAADGVGARGICSWRNVLQNEQITGEVTELNAECYGALCAIAVTAKALNKRNEAQRYNKAAGELREAANHYLIDPETNLYYRNIDLKGRVFSEATVDMVFALLFGLADRRSKEASISRLQGPDFMTPGGLRVLSFNNPRWDPSGQSGCMGGVWPGVTWWFAMGCKNVHSDMMAKALEHSYEYLVRDPQTYNTVPGQFSEWSDGETLVNRGMRLSPWAPPRFLWAAIEGIAGVKVMDKRVEVRPELPSSWLWLHLLNLQLGDQRVSYFLTRQKDGPHLYTCSDFRSPLPVHQYETELSDRVEPLTTGMTATAMQKDGEIILFFASSRDHLLVGPLLTYRAIKASRRYHVWRLSSMEQDWRDLGQIPASNLVRLAVQIEPQGYTLYRLCW